MAKISTLPTGGLVTPDDLLVITRDNAGSPASYSAKLGETSLAMTGAGVIGRSGGAGASQIVSFEALMGMVDVTIESIDNTGATDVQTALEALVAANSGKVIRIPPGTYLGSNSGQCVINDCTVIAYGAVFLNLFIKTVNNVKWFGGHVLQDVNGTNSQAAFRFEGSNSSVFHASVDAEESFTAFEVRDQGTTTRENISIESCYGKARSGMTIFGSRRVTVRNCRVASYKDDDAFVIKDSLGNGVDGVSLIGNIVESTASALLAIGSEVLSGGYVKNVLMADSIGYGSKVLHIKPGAIQDVGGYAGGVVEGIRVDNCILSDPDGNAMSRPIFLTVGRGARISSVDVSGVTIRGRHKTDASPRNFISITTQNIDATAGSTIEDVNIQNAKYIDTYEGLGNAVERPGYELIDAIAIENAANQVIGDITFDGVSVDGSGGSFSLQGATETIAGKIKYKRCVAKKMRRTQSTRYVFHDMQKAQISDFTHDEQVTASSAYDRYLSVQSGASVVLDVAGEDHPELIPASIGSTFLQRATAKLFLRGASAWNAVATADESVTLVDASAGDGNTTLVTSMEFGKKYHVKVQETTAFNGSTNKDFKLGTSAGDASFMAAVTATGSAVGYAEISGTENVGSNIVLSWLNNATPTTGQLTATVKVVG